MPGVDYAGGLPANKTVESVSTGRFSKDSSQFGFLFALALGLASFGAFFGSRPLLREMRMQFVVVRAARTAIEIDDGLSVSSAHKQESPHLVGSRQAHYPTPKCPLLTARTYRPTKPYFWAGVPNVVSLLFQRRRAPMRQIISSEETLTTLGSRKKRDGATSSSSISRRHGTIQLLRHVVSPRLGSDDRFQGRQCSPSPKSSFTSQLH
jgi:hypothetical protein